MAADNKQLLLFGHTLPGNEISLLERIKDCADKRNKGICVPPTTALHQLPADQITQISVGSNHVAFLLKDSRVVRLHYEIVKNIIEPTIPIDTKGETGPSGSSNTPAATGGSGAASSSDAAAAAAAAAANAANRTAKIRRIMMARPGARSSGFCRTGVIIDRNRSRPVIPASAVSEELIVQCQVVLQGKSREVIVRELQRTNLNVNEAVNNLLSRDDDEMDDMYHQHITPIGRQAFAGDNIDESSEAYLHEELLSLLDAGLRDTGSAAAAALLDSESIYSAGDGYEYLISRDLARRRGEEGKSKDATKEPDAGQTTQEQIVLGDKLIYWGEAVDNETAIQFQYPADVKKFIKIASMHSELLALADNGKIYTWSWEKDAKPSKQPHPLTNKFYSDGSQERIIEMESCGLRTVILTNSQKIASFMDSSCGRKLGEAFSETLVEVPEEVSQLFCTTLYSAILTKSGKIFWRGIYPFNERRKLWEKARSKKKQVTFETGTEIVVGSEVRTKATPIFSIGSVAVNFNEGIPMIGILNEDAWTLNETCRFRIETPESYDSKELEKPSNQKEKRVWFNLAGNRKRNASATEGGEHQGGENAAIPAKSTNNAASFVLRAWNLKDVIFIHEECINDTSIVKIVDGAYCGVVFKSTLDKLEAENGGTSVTAADLIKGIRLMRKDDLVLVSSFSRGSRSPENFQVQLKQLRLPSSVNRIISLALDSTGFRILCEERSQLHLLRIGCLGKLFSNHLLPINLNALCQNETADEANLPAVSNFGEEGFLLLRDGAGNFQPFIRNAIGGFKEMAYIGLGRIYRFGLGIQYYKSPNKINSNNTTISTEQFTMDKKTKIGVSYKDSNRVLLMAALIAPNPESGGQPAIDSLMQAILFCNLELVREILRKLDAEVNTDMRKTYICERIDGNRNIFHIAALNSSAKTNKDQADLEPGEAQIESQPKFDNSEAEAAKARYDRKWQEMLGSTPTTRSKSLAVKEAAGKEQQQAEEKKEASTSSLESGSSRKEKGATDEQQQKSFEDLKKISTQPKERQANSISIVHELCKSTAIHDYFFELMQQQDVNGLTPFETAIHNRAYSAALTLWESTQEKKDWSQDTVEILLSTPADGCNDDSALFIICANDTCSYTWTGEEHAPQDIYECKTCGLVGTLCCCSECAYLCHRKHDCKLKRTSPVAYCDCWEKSDCKTLVAGNNTKRELLLQLMLHNSKLVERLNSRGEHLLMFLSRTVGRQLIEQESYVKRSKRPGPGQTTTANGIRIPEHDLDPPKFARKALNMALSNWDVVRSLMEIGMKKPAANEAPIFENTFHLGEHDGSTHLDKFVFTLLAWCEESSLDVLLNLFVRMANKQKQTNSDVHIVIQRFVRSVIRLFILVLLLSPNAIGTLLATISGNIIKALPITDGTGPAAPATGMALSSSVQSQTPHQGTPGGSLRELQNYRAVAMSGMLSLVRASLPAALGFGPAGTDKKDIKKNKIIAFVTKCRRVFQTLLSYSINELIGAADAMIAPVRYGIVKPTGTIAANDDVLDLIQQHLNNEQDLSTIINDALHNNNAGANQFAAIAGAGQIKKLADMRRGERQIGNEERGSDEENSNDEDEDEEEADAAQSIATFSRTRENSSASTFAPPIRTLSEQQNRRRRDTNNTMEMNLDENIEEDQNEDNMDEEDESEHGHDDEIDDDEDEDENAYFDIHDEDDDDGDDSDNSDDDENAPEGEGDSNDTATIGGADAIGGGEDTISEVRVELGSTDDSIMGDGEQRRVDAEIAISQGSLPQSTANRSVDGENANSRSISTNNNNDNTVAGSTSTSFTEGNNPSSNRSIFRENSERIFNRARESRSTVLRTSVNNTGTGTTQASMESSEPPRPTGQPPVASSTAATGTAATTVAPTEDEGYSPSNTSTQLAISFSVIVKLIDELLLQLMVHSKWKQQIGRSKGITAMLDLDANLFNTFKAILEEYYEPTWNWFQAIMDRTEAQLKYGNAINNVSVGSLFNLVQIGQEQGEDRLDEQGGSAARTRRTEVQRRYKRRLDRMDGTKRGDAWGSGGVENDQQDANARTEFFGYFLSLLRSAAAENGDDFPQLEYNALKNVAFVAEAYLFHVNFLDLLRQTELETDLGTTKFDGKESLMELNKRQDSGKKLRRFYQRSNSISYPLLSTAEKHHAFTFTAAEALPLSAKIHLLNADAERDSLFALPTPARSRSAHKEIASDHGIKFPTHQSLSHPPLKYAEVVERLQQSSSIAPSGPQNPARNSSRSIAVQHFAKTSDESKDEGADPIGLILNSKLGLTASAIQLALGRWSKTITLFTRTFHDDLINSYGGDSIHSVLLNKTGVCSFNVRHAQFRKQMDKLKNTQGKDLAFTQMPREKYSILQQTFRQLNQHYVRRLSGSATTTPTQQQQQLANAIASATAAGEMRTPPLASHKVKVTFRDEPGEGTGVARHFYAAIAEALTTIKHLPSPDNVNEDGTSKPLDPRGSTPGKSASTGAASVLAAAATAAGKGNNKNNTISSSTASPTSTARMSTAQRGVSAEGALSTYSTSTLTVDTQPLFYRAAKTTGFFTPITGSCTPQRLNAFRNVGRMMGICLQQSEIFPLPLCRHVFKFILGRHITWFDLAFFDPSLFDSLRSIVYNEEKDEYHPQDFYEALEMTFSVDLPAEEGGGTFELKPGGAEIPVNRENVLEYIYLFVEHRLLGPHIPCLEAVSRGVFDVIPADSLANLTAEDLRLILCGTQEVNVQLLQNFTKLLDESSASPEVLAKYKKTFWSVVNKFTNTEKQDLCFFWTGSPNLPSTEEGFQPLPTIMIRPADDVHLPTANTCISRLYMPLYSSKKILASKLQMAIKVRNFGFV